MTSTARKRKPASQQGVQVTVIDLDLINRLIRYQGTTAPVLMRYVFPGLHRSGVYARLERLVRVGLLEDLCTGPSNVARPRTVKALYVPTPLAYKMVGSSLGYKSVSLATVLHTLAVSEVGLDFEGRGWTVITDREIRRHLFEWRTASDRSIADTAPWVGEYDGEGVSAKENLKAKQSVQTHRPDLVLIKERSEGDVSGACRVAVEVELSRKSPARLRQILRDHGRTTRFEEVWYFTPDRASAIRIAEAIGTLPSEQRAKFSIKRYVPLHAVEPSSAQSTRSGEIGESAGDVRGTNSSNERAEASSAPGLQEAAGVPANPIRGAEPPQQLRTRRRAAERPIQIHEPDGFEAAPDCNDPTRARSAWFTLPGAPGQWASQTDDRSSSGGDAVREHE